MKKIVIFTQVSEPQINQVKKVVEHVDLSKYEVHFVHCHKIQYYVNELSVYSFPTEDQFDEMEKATNCILKSLSEEMNISNAQVHTFFDADPKQRCSTFLEDIGADLCAVATKGTKGIEGIFESSFANYMNKYAKCDVLVLRP
jgi:nucleotide-binding universal stress UspA family protein